MKKNGMIYSLRVGILFLGLTIFAWIKPADMFSATERRELDQFPELSWETISNGRFMREFEEYTLDQFPFRDEFRSIKAFTHFYVFGQNDNNDVYQADGYVSKLDYPMSETALDRAVKKFTSIYDIYIKDSNAKVYSAWIPDKNYFLAEKNGYPAYDYEEMYSYLNENLDFMTNIEISDLLSVEDYYYTDTHWRQECILDVAQRLRTKMDMVSGRNVVLEDDMAFGDDAEQKTSDVEVEETDITQNADSFVELMEEYVDKSLETPFYGVYYGQLALPIEPDYITYLEHPMFEDCTIINHESGKEIPMYDMELAVGRDPYEMYLSGSKSVITIENPNASTEKELVLFRDSFGSSITPLMVEEYAKITLLDVRYLNERMIGQFVEFTDQDVLFLFSTGVLNNQTAF